MKQQKTWKEFGQTTVEYILMLAVVVAVGIKILKTFEDYLIKNPNSFINIYLNDFKSNLGDPNSGGYKFFKLRK